METDIQTLMNKDPVEMTKTNLNDMITFFRNNRDLFNQVSTKKPSKIRKDSKAVDIGALNRKIDL